MLTSQVRLLTGYSGTAAVEFEASLVGEAISLPTYRRAKLLSSNSAFETAPDLPPQAAYLACCSAKFPIKGIL